MNTRAYLRVWSGFSIVHLNCCGYRLRVGLVLRAYAEVVLAIGTHRVRLVALNSVFTNLGVYARRSVLHLEQHFGIGALPIRDNYLLVGGTHPYGVSVSDGIPGRGLEHNLTVRLHQHFAILRGKATLYVDVVSILQTGVIICPAGIHHPYRHCVHRLVAHVVPCHSFHGMRT